MSLYDKAQIPPLLSYELENNLSIDGCTILDDFKLISINKTYSSVEIMNTTIKGELFINLSRRHGDVNVQICLSENVHEKDINIIGSANFDLWVLDIDVNKMDLGSADKNSFSNKYSEINIINTDKKNNIKSVDLKNSTIGKFSMNDIKLDKFNCSNSTFEKKVEIKKCLIKKIAFFKNTRFKALCDFYKTEFCCNSFDKTTFQDIAVFTESTFHKNVNFKYTTFEKLALFRKTMFEGSLNLEDSIIKEEANFLGITFKKSKEKKVNRETARIIKHSFEKQNNIIEANKFYALEMNERENELSKDMKIRKNIFEWLIFKIHGISSNHSKSGPLALFWIILVSFIYTYLAIDTEIGIVSFYDVLNYDFINTIALNINPFSIMTNKEPITFGLLLFKIIIAYLIYQFIVSVRQNTRRK